MSNRNNKRIPKSKVRLTTNKKPTIDSSISPDSILKIKPAWRLGKIDFLGEWGFNNIDKSIILKMLHEKLKNFEGMTWGEIERKKGRSGNKINHEITIDKVCKEAQNRLKKLKLIDEYDTLYSLHINGKERLWGIRDFEAFDILWWDPDHTVYPVGLKHT